MGMIQLVNDLVVNYNEDFLSLYFTVSMFLQKSCVFVLYFPIEKVGIQVCLTFQFVRIICLDN